MKAQSRPISLAALILAMVLIASGQTVRNDSTYYDSWEGQWYQEVDGKTGDQPSFIVKRALYHSSFEELWFGTGGLEFSMAWRAWDSRTKQWDFAWMSTDGLFQLWEGKKIDGAWYMYRTFIINGDEVLSRQAFIPKDDTTLIRTSEHSRDGGRTWTLRFREVYRKRS